MKPKKNTNNRKTGHRNTVADDLRQLIQPPEFRIEESGVPINIEMPVDSPSQLDTAVVTALEPASSLNVHALAEIATSLWYMKTKFFKRKWDDDSGSDEDPRIRRALGRLNKGVDALKAVGIEIDDRTNKRYPQGGANLMRPIELLPTDGITYEIVIDTITPIVFFEAKLIQSGEVFVAVPLIQTTAPSVEREPPDLNTAIPRGAEQVITNEQSVAPADTPPGT